MLGKTNDANNWSGRGSKLDVGSFEERLEGEKPVNLGGTQEKSQPRVAPLEPLLWKGYLERETSGGGVEGPAGPELILQRVVRTWVSIYRKSSHWRVMSRAGTTFCFIFITNYIMAGFFDAWQHSQK